MQEKSIDSKKLWEQTWASDPMSATSPWVSAILRREDIRDKKVLDLGHGNGYHTNDFREAKLFVGADISINASRSAKRYSPTNDYVAIEGSQLSFRDKSFDSVFALDMLPVLGENAYPTLKEMARVSSESVIFTIAHNDAFRFHERVPIKNLEYGTLYNNSRVDQFAVEENGLLAMLSSLKLESKEMRVFTDDEMESLVIPAQMLAITPGGNIKQSIYVRALRRD